MPAKDLDALYAAQNPDAAPQHPNRVDQMAELANYLTRAQAAESLGISVARVSIVARRDNWTFHPVGRSHLFEVKDMMRTAYKMEAQKAWRLLKIPLPLWGQPYLADMNVVRQLECACGEIAYQPGPGTGEKISKYAACPSCQEIFVP